jgi:hypothetical protein
MHVVIHDPGNVEGPRIERALRSRGIPTVVSLDQRRTTAALEGTRAEVVLLCARTFAPEILAFAEELRGRLVLEPAQLQLVTGPLQDGDTAQVFDAGFDAIVPWGSSDVALLARVAAAERLLERCERKPDAPAFLAGEDAAATLPQRLVTRSNTWRGAVELLRDVVARFYSHQTTVLPLDDDGELRIDRAAVNFLTGSANGVQLRVGVGVDEASGSTLAAKFVGHDGDHLIDDMLTELANTLTGALKKQLGLELLPFTAGIPVLLAPRELSRPTILFAQRHEATFEVARARLLLQVGMTSRALFSVDVDNLREGLVLAQDLHGTGGELMLRRGTRLSQAMIRKLADRLSARTRLQVMST